MDPGRSDLPEIRLSDEDIIDAMRRIPGYIDISTDDFRAVYRLAHGHALERLLGGITAGRLMRTGFTPLRPGMYLDEAARSLADQRLKGMPVVDDGGRVIGMLTETDYLRRLGADTFLELLLRLVTEPEILVRCCHETEVAAAMTVPAITVGPAAGFGPILRAFKRHEGRGMPVVDQDGRLLGLLLRKDFVDAHGLEDLVGLV